MSESNQPFERSLNDPVRIVYHVGSRTFARLFNEQSLEEVKDVVRRKLGVGSETDVSLKQMGPGALLDLEDGDDFQAFRVLLKGSVSVDIQVTVGRSQGSTMLPPATPQPREPPLASKPTTTISLTTSSTESASGQPSAHPKAIPSVETSTVPAEIPLARKRKVSFDEVRVPASDKPKEQREPVKPVAIVPVASTNALGSPAVPKPVVAEEPQKKKLKESTKTKDVQITGATESPTTKASTPKLKPKKSIALSRGTEAGTTVSKDTETSEPPMKKRKKVKKDSSTSPNKSSASVKQDGMDRSISQRSIPVKEALLQPAAEKALGLGAEGGTPTTRKSEKSKAPRGTACAAIPQTSASTSVQSEVAAAILSGYLSKASETIPPKPTAKRKSVKRDTKKTSASSSAFRVEPATALDTPANEMPNVLEEHRPEPVVLTIDPPRTPKVNGPPCPICLGEPFHIRYYCPVVLKGPDAIRERLEVLRGIDMGSQQLLIKQLEGLLRDSKVTSSSSLDAVPTNDVQSGKASPPSFLFPRISNIPSNSLSEVTVESKDEGSSSESSDSMSEGGVENQELSGLQRQRTTDEQPLPSNSDLEAVIHGPTSKQRSILDILDLIIGDGDEVDSNSEEDVAVLEEDPDEGAGQTRRQLSRRVVRSFDTESEEESRSPSLSQSTEDTSNDIGPGLRGSKAEPTKHQEDDIVMRDSVDSPVLEEQVDDSSEETHVESDDRMNMDQLIGGKEAAIIAEEQPSSPILRAPDSQLLDAPRNEPRGSGKIRSSPNVDGNVPVALETFEAEADPIEPADDLEPPTTASCLPNADPIEAPSEDIGSLFTSVTQSTPRPGVSKRIKTRNGRVLDDEADRPVLLEQLTSEATDKVTPLSVQRKSLRDGAKSSASQELSPTSVRPVDSMRQKTRAQDGIPSSHKSLKTPAKQSEERSDASKISTKNNAVQNVAYVAPTSSVRWETLAEPSSPSLPLDESPVFTDELMSSSPYPDCIAAHTRSKNQDKGQPRRQPATPISQGKERLFDPSSSQIPFPYSQNQARTEGEETTDSEGESKMGMKRMLRSRYRSLSQLTSQAKLFPPSLPTPANKSVTIGKAKKRAVDEDSSSSSSSDADEANGSEHIPQGRRAGSVLKAKKRKSLA